MDASWRQKRWRITGLGTLGNALQGGLIFWSLGLYAASFEDHFGVSRQSINLIETMLSVGVNVLSVFVGRWVDTRSARHAVAVGCGCLGAGLIIVSQAGTLLQIWVVFLTIIPLGILCLGVVPSTALISRWFRQRRGLALGISVTGSSVGGFLAPPAIAWLFLQYGWRVGMLCTGIFVVVLAPVFFLGLVNRPEDVGQQLPVGPSPSAERIDKQDWQILEMLQTRTLYLQVLISGALLGITLGFLANLGFHSKDLGLPSQHTALLYSVIALLSFGGKIASGAFIDRAGIKWSGGLTVVLMVTAMSVFIIADDFASMLVGSAIMGLAIGGVSPLWTSMAAIGFGAANAGRTLGLHNPLHLPITAPSAPLAGYISDTTGSYDLMFIVYAIAAIAAGGALYALRQPVRPAQPIPRWLPAFFHANRTP